MLAFGKAIRRTSIRLRVSIHQTRRQLRAGRSDAARAGRFVRVEGLRHGRQRHRSAPRRRPRCARQRDALTRADRAGGNQHRRYAQGRWSGDRSCDDHRDAGRTGRVHRRRAAAINRALQNEMKRRIKGFLDRIIRRTTEAATFEASPTILSAASSLPSMAFRMSGSGSGPRRMNASWNFCSEYCGAHLRLVVVAQLQDHQLAHRVVAVGRRPPCRACSRARRPGAADSPPSRRTPPPARTVMPFVCIRMPDDEPARRAAARPGSAPRRYRGSSAWKPSSITICSQ